MEWNCILLCFCFVFISSRTNEVKTFFFFTVCVFATWISSSVFISHTFFLPSCLVFFLLFFSNYDTIPLSVSAFANTFCLFYYCWRSRTCDPSWPRSWTLTFRGCSPHPLSLEWMLHLPFPHQELFQGHSLKGVRCFGDHLDGIYDWVPPRPVCKPLGL